MSRLHRARKNLLAKFENGAVETEMDKQHIRIVK